MYADQEIHDKSLVKGIIMKCILMTQAGAPDILQPAQLDIPQITHDRQVRVRLHAAGVNPVDTKLRGRGTYYPDRMPAILGCDGAGTVEAVGSAVSRFKPGDEVYYCYGGIGGDPGNYAEYNVVDESVLAHKPTSLDFAAAAAAPLVLITAWEALYDRAGMKEGQDILIHAGAGGVGHVAIQLAKAAGCRVITTVSSPEKAQFVSLLGADEVVRYDQEESVSRVLELTAGKGVDIAFDTVGGKVFEQCYAATRPYGDIVSLLQPPIDMDWKAARMRNQRTSLELMLSPQYYGWDQALAHQGDILRRCAELFDSGCLKLHVSHRLPLSEVAEAHRLIEQGGMVGKIALLMA